MSISLSYSPSLDGIRALAALMVAGAHAQVPGLTGGFFGVDVFFVLSGFLITRLLREEHAATGCIHLRGFWGRRLRRLWPALMAFLLVYVLASPFVWAKWSLTRHLQDALLTAAYAVNWATTAGGGVAVLRHVWSLAVEMQFYLVWPPLFVALMRVSPRLLVPFLVCAYVLATGWRWLGAEGLERAWDFYVRTDMHCSGLILGCLIGLVNLRLRQAWAVLGLLMLALASTFFSSGWTATAQYGFTVVEWAAAMIVAARPGWLGAQWFAWFGRMSYGFYLWHYLVMVELRSLPQADWRVTLLVGGAVGLLAAVVSHHLVERRFHRPRFEGRPREGAPVAPSVLRKQQGVEHV
jgi:peptidoglycan/LPS O-acetylase OafA/YrhL